MKLDMHCHVVGKGNDITKIDTEVYFNAVDNQHWFTRILYNLLEDDLIRIEADLNKDGTISTDEYFDLIYYLLESSDELDGIVLLAFDAVYSSKTGILDEQKTDLWVSNKFLSERIKKVDNKLQKAGINKRFFLGASVSPNRKDWEKELEYVISLTETVLIKLIPSAQHIHIEDKRHEDFYRALAANNIPLLCHVGPEYSFPEGIRNQELDNFRHLKRPLECGVKVIAAHCATPVFPVADKSLIKDFYSFMKDANGEGKVRLWADTSALSLSTRLPFIPEILNTFSPEWLVHGSDFPIPIDGWTHLPYVAHDITPKEYIDIYKTKNPLDRDIKIKRAHGFSESIIENAEKVLRLSV